MSTGKPASTTSSSSNGQQKQPTTPITSSSSLPSVITSSSRPTALPTRPTPNLPSRAAFGRPSTSSNVNGSFRWLEGRKYLNVPGSTYFLPNDEQEADRLNLEHYMLRWAFEGNFSAPVKDRLSKGGKVLDIGCGTGTWLLEMAAEFPNAHFVGIDISKLFPETIKPKNVNFHITNVLEGLPFADGIFDFVHMRMMLYSFRVDDWQKVVRELYRVTKPGGWVQLTEIDPYVQKMSEETKAIIEKIFMVLTARGQDPFAPHKLNKFLQNAGYEEVTKSYVSIPIGWGSSLGQMMKADWVEWIRGARPLLAPVFAMTDDEFEDMIDQISSDARRSKSYHNFYVGYGMRPMDSDV